MSGWTPEQFYAKAKLYIDRGLTEGSTLRAWWLHFAVEPLLRAVVAKRHPILLAGRDSLNGMLVALGEDPLADGAVTSRMTSELVTRVIPKVLGVTQWPKTMETRAELLIERRNAECHSPDAAFEGLAEGSWLPDFLRVAAVCCDYLGTPLEDLIGEALAQQARDIAAEDDEKVRRLVERLIAEAKARPLTGATSAFAGTEFVVKTDGTAIKLVPCPACRNEAELGGRPFAKGPIRVQDGSLEQRVTIAAGSFECPSCELRLVGGPQIVAAELEATFETTEYIDAWQELGLDVTEELERQGLHVVNPEDAWGYQDE